MADLTIVPVTEDRFGDLVELFGTRGDPSWCWCQYFRTTGDSYHRSAEHNRSQLCAQVQSATVPVGLIAYAAGLGPMASSPSAVVGSEQAADMEPPSAARRPVGWVQAGPRPSFPRITGSRTLRAVAAEVDDDLGDESVWAITCFVVKVGWRRQGVATALLAGAIELARDHGASAVVGHPVDVAARATRVGGSELYHGVVSTFAAAGFEVVGRTGATRPVMRLELDRG
jgi:GNAT superfamily N-acetyltransferase